MPVIVRRRHNQIVLSKAERRKIHRPDPCRGLVLNRSDFGIAIVTTIFESVAVVTVRASTPVCPSLVAHAAPQPVTVSPAASVPAS